VFVNARKTVRDIFLTLALICNPVNMLQIMM